MFIIFISYVYMYFWIKFRVFLFVILIINFVMLFINMLILFVNIIGLNELDIVFIDKLFIIVIDNYYTGYA